MLKARQQRGRLAAAMRFNDANHNFDAGLLFLLGGGQHGESFTDARIGAEINAQLAACGALLVAPKLGQQLVGIGA